MQQLWGMSESGYTLLETLVVFAIISVVIAITPTAYSTFIPQYQLKQFANDVAVRARLLRREASEDHTVTGFTIVGTQGLQIFGTAEFLQLPSGTNVEFNPEGLWDREGNTVLFYPTGGSSGGNIVFTKGTLSLTVKINWISGAVEVQV